MDRGRIDPVRNDSGLALVVALLVTMISFIVVTAVLAQAMHNISEAGYMRRRLSAISAAEAGLNWYWKTLEKTSLEALKTGGWKQNGSVWEFVGSDVASAPDRPVYLLRVRYLAANPCADPVSLKLRACSYSDIAVQDLAADPFPATIYAIVTSVGCVPDSSDSGNYVSASEKGDCWKPAATRSVRRSLQTVMRLRTRYGGVSGSVTASYVCLDEAGKLTMSGDLYVMGAPMEGPPGWPTDCKTGVVVGTGDELTMSGSLFAAQGDLSVSSGGTMTVVGNVWAKDKVILGDGTDLQKLCTDQNIKICVKGNATGSSVTIGSQAAVEGATMACDPACPPTILDFPQIVWDDKDWSNWVIKEQSSLSKTSTPVTLAGAMGNPLSRTVYHLTGSDCVVTLDGRFTINVDFAIVGECRFELSSSTEFLGTGTLMLMSLWPDQNPKDGKPDGLTATQCGGGNVEITDPTDPLYKKQKRFVPGPRDVYMHNNPATSGPNFFLYTPCSLKIDNNQNPVKGQLVARFLWIKNQANVSLVSVSGGGGIDIPGVVSGFTQDVRYINEITVDAALA